MTTIESITEKSEIEVKDIDFRNLELRIGSLILINGKEEFVLGATFTETYDERRKLERFRTARREIDGGISELGYSVNRSDGKEHLDFSGIFYGEEHLPYQASERYQKLNEFLQGIEK